MIRFVLPLAVLMATPAIASDSRIATHFYEPSSIVRMAGRQGWQSTIEFATDEHIENVAVGDSSSWQVTPNKRANLLFLKPMTAKASTNMTVVTDQRTYLFDLTTTLAEPTYVLRFTYPRAIPTPESGLSKALMPASTPPSAPAPTSASAPQALAQTDSLHFGWTSQGDKRLLPATTFDDGHQTFVAWGKDVAMPAILSIQPDGTEGPVNYAVKGETIVIDGVPDKLILRAGKATATLSAPPTSVAAAPTSTSRLAER